MLEIKKYKRLLDMHDKLISRREWDDEKRDSLVREMDKIWNGWEGKGQKKPQEAALAYTRELYSRRIN